MNKKLIAMLFLMAPLTIFAQKFGHLNSADIMPMMPEYKTAQTELENLEKQMTNELQMMESELAKKSEAYDKEKATLPANIQQRREQELQDLYGRMQQYYQQSQQQLAQASQEKMAAITEKIMKAGGSCPCQWPWRPFRRPCSLPRPCNPRTRKQRWPTLYQDGIP